VCRLPRCAGSRRRLLTLVERRSRGMGELGATCEKAAALETVLTEGPRTQDIGGRTSTREVGKAIAEAV
jgi:hypothetical protein